MSKSTQVRKIVRYYLVHVQKYPSLRRGVLISLPLTVVVNSYLPPLILANVLSRLSLHHYQAHHVWGSFGPQLVVYALLILSGMIGWRVVDWFNWRLEGNVQRDIAHEVFNHMLVESADFHANNFAGSLVSQTGKLMTGYVRSADTTVYQVMPLLTGIVAATTILAIRAPQYALVLFGFAVFYLVSAFIVSRTVLRLSAEHATAESQQTGFLADAITNVMTIKSFAGGKYERQRFAEVTANTENSLYRFASAQRKLLNYLGTTSRAISATSLTMAVVIVLVFGSNIGAVFLILTYTASIVDGLFQFSNNSLRNYNRSLGDANDMVEVLSQRPAIVDPEKPEKLRIRKGSIDFKNVVFTHAGSNDALFRELNLQIKNGEKIGLVGHSGSGKTTFTRLLLRFSDVDGGEILIDGQNIAHITQDGLHSQIAYVPQEPLLFHRTIAENINYGKPEATRADIERVAKMAHAAEFIELLPQGYETLVGERGVKLSGGQRQRVAIARAMLKDAPILVLDEATSSLDSESEVLIQDALWKLMEGRTAIVIAHRLSTIQKMDRIVVLDDGHIVEQGTHHELLKAKGTYAKLWAHQSGGFMED